MVHIDRHFRDVGLYDRGYRAAEAPDRIRKYSGQAGELAPLYPPAPPGCLQGMVVYLLF